MATQTQQPPTIVNPNIAQSQGFQNQPSIDTSIVPPVKTSEQQQQRPVKKGSDKSRKDKNRYSTSMRAAMAGQQQPGRIFLNLFVYCSIIFNFNPSI